MVQNKNDQINPRLTKGVIETPTFFPSRSKMLKKVT